jgi:hypothetical protein
LEIDWDLLDKTRRLRLHQNINKLSTIQQIILALTAKDLREKERGV